MAEEEKKTTEGKDSPTPENKETKPAEVKSEEKKPEETKAPEAAAKPAEGGEKKEEVKTEAKPEEKKEEAKPAVADKKPEEGEKKTGEEAGKSKEGEVKPAEGDATGKAEPKKFKFPFSKAEPTDPALMEKELAALLPEERVAKEANEQVMEKEDEDKYLTVRINKTKGLLLGGIVIVVMWLVPLVSWAVGMIDLSGLKDKVMNLPMIAKSSPEPTPAAENVVDESVVKVRIRYKEDKQAEEANGLVSKLQLAGISYVEAVIDSESEYDGVSVIGKPGKDEWVVKVKETLTTEKYELASSSAQLTEDSDFDVVVLLGEEK